MLGLKANPNVLECLYSPIVESRSGPEKGTLQAADLAFHTCEYERLTAHLQSAYEASKLPEMPSARKELNNLLVRLRLRDS